MVRLRGLRLARLLRRSLRLGLARLLRRSLGLIGLLLRRSLGLSLRLVRLLRRRLSGLGLEGRRILTHWLIGACLGRRLGLGLNLYLLSLEHRGNLGLCRGCSRLIGGSWLSRDGLRLRDRLGGDSVRLGRSRLSGSGLSLWLRRGRSGFS